MPTFIRHGWSFLFLMSLCIGCSSAPSVPAGTSNCYAKGFDLQDSADCCIVTVYSPWNRTEVQARYVVSESAKDAMQPISRWAVSSCTHVGMLDALHLRDSLVGVCLPELVYADLTHTLGAKNGHLDLGDPMQLSVERVLAAQPEAMMLTVYSSDDHTATNLQALGVQVIYNNEWMENHPLGRAEWIRLLGVLTGKRHEADSLFETVVVRYDSLLQVVLTYQKHTLQPPSIVSGQDFRGTWYVPSGATYMGQLFHDAGASYHYENDQHEGSIPLTMEQALRDFADADVWVGVNAHTLLELEQASAKHTWFQAFQNQRVYNFMGRTNQQGANDFWERGVVHPDELLEDLIHVLYNDSAESLLYMQHLL